MKSFRAFAVDRSSSEPTRNLTDLPLTALGDGDVTVRVSWSGINYKDALAADPNGRVARISPLIPGIDLAGEVVDSDSPDFTVGQAVLAHGYGLGVSHHGGFAEVARIPADWIVPLDRTLTPRDAMAIGTAGYTAALCVLALEEHGVEPGSGEVLVLGATGGVGSLAVSILHARGHDVVAVTGKTEHAERLHALGAKEVVSREDFLADPKPLGPERWAGCVDAAGGAPLARALSTLTYGGAAAVCGNVGGPDLATSIFPFILRAATLYGIDSVQTPIARRRELWRRLGDDLRPPGLETMTTECTLEDLPQALDATLRGTSVGRTLVHIG